MISGVANIDWEDLASFSLDGKSYLLVADTGDNSGSRPSYHFYIIREPNLPAAGKRLEKATDVAWKIDFQYEGGPRDCEAVAVDEGTGKIIFLSKRTKRPEVYELPLRAPKKTGIQVAKPIGRLETKAPRMVIAPYHSQPTGLDLSADGSLAAVVTYYGVFLFPRQPQESWTDAFARDAVKLGPHHLRQAESVAFSRDVASIFVVSEGLRSPIVKFLKTPVAAITGE